MSSDSEQPPRNRATNRPPIAPALVEARAGGLAFAEIHARARAGEYLPEQIPPDIFLPELY